MKVYPYRIVNGNSVQGFATWTETLTTCVAHLAAGNTLAVKGQVYDSLDELVNVHDDPASLTLRVLAPQGVDG